MALPASGTLRFTQIKTEFGGGSPPANFRSYRKGAGYVTVSDTAPNVPSSGAMEIRDFLGAAKASGFTASASPASVSGAGNGMASQDVDSGYTTIIPSGGTAPYTYSWAWVSGDTLSVSGTSYARFTGWVDVDAEVTAVYRCTVRDNTSATATVDVTIYLSNWAP